MVAIAEAVVEARMPAGATVKEAVTTLIDLADADADADEAEVRVVKVAKTITRAHRTTTATTTATATTMVADVDEVAAGEDDSLIAMAAAVADVNHQVDEAVGEVDETSHHVAVGMSKVEASRSKEPSKAFWN